MSESSHFKRVNCGKKGRFVTVVVRDETGSIRYELYIES